MDHAQLFLVLFASVRGHAALPENVAAAVQKSPVAQDLLIAAQAMGSGPAGAPNWAAIITAILAAVQAILPLLGG